MDLERQSCQPLKAQISTQHLKNSYFAFKIRIFFSTSIVNIFYLIYVPTQQEFIRKNTWTQSLPMWSSIWYTKQCMQCHCHDILSTYRTKCMLFAFSRSFGDEVKLCSIFADVISSLFKLRFPQFTVQNYKRRGDRIRPMFARDLTTASHSRCT